MRYLIILLTFLFMKPTYSQDKMQVLKFGTYYQLEAPDFFTSFPIDSSSKTILKYGDIVKFFHMSVIMESKEEVKKQEGKVLDLKTYYKRITEEAAKQLEKGYCLSPVEAEVHGIKGLKSVVQGNYEGGAFLFDYFMFEDKTHYYQVLVWTKPEREPAVETMIDQIFRSIRPL